MQTATVIPFPTPPLATPPFPAGQEKGVTFVADACTHFSSREPFPTDLMITPADDARRALASAERDQSPDIADLLIAMEDAPWSETLILEITGIDRRVRVFVAIGAVRAALEPADARLMARMLIDEQAFTGAIGVATRLFDAADQVEMTRPFIAALAPADPDEPPQFSARRTLAAFGLIGAALAILVLADRMGAMMGGLS